jgi:RNA polymerase sigma-70 factor (sigma-E family)
MAPPAGRAEGTAGAMADDVTVVAVGTFDDLYRQEYAPMVRLAFLLVDSTEVAEEVVQDAFASVFERYARLGNPGGYLRTCVVHGCRTVQRRRGLARRKVPEPPPASSELATDHVLDAVRRLPEQRRAAVVLRYYADLPEAEIAAALGVRPGTVKSMLHRALAQLREEVER